jgi:hypothetical protein
MMVWASVVSGGLFIFIGAHAETAWLRPEITLDQEGYVPPAPTCAPLEPALSHVLVLAEQASSSRGRRARRSRCCGGRLGG